MPIEVKWGISLAAGAGLVWLGWKAPPVLIAFHVLLCLILMIVILLQSGSAADLAGAFGGAGSQTAFGPRSAATFLTKATTWCAIMFMLTSGALTIRQSNLRPLGSSVLEKSQAPASQPKPSPAPAPAPAAPQNFPPSH
jgi:preprotein translocase subunit SecG